MPFKSKNWLAAQLAGVIGNDDPLTGKKLANTLSKFSLGILPPTLGVVTGKVPAIQAYNATPDKIIGIEKAVNAFAAQNTAGMSIITAGLFVGTAPPPLKGTKQLFEFVKQNNLKKEYLCKTLAAAIWINWTLGRSTFTPISIPIPSWNIPFLPVAVQDEIDTAQLNRDAQVAIQQEEYKQQINDQADPNNPRLLDTESFFEETNRID